MKKNIKRNGPGRPAYQPKFPSKLKWTMADFCARNGVDPETGKGPNCAKLTLVNFLRDDLKNSRTGLIAKVKDETAAPNSEKGLGRPSFLYYLRSRKAEIVAKATEKSPRKSNLKSAAKSPVSVTLNTTEGYEAMKKSLGVDAPTVPVTAPEPTVDTATAPVVPTEPETATANS